MKNFMTTDELKEMFLYVSQQVIESEKFLTEIDKKIGDGDHGIIMSLGFKEVKNQLSAGNFYCANEVFKTIGMTLLDTMGGASGVLFGTIFISGIVGLEPVEHISLPEFAGIFERSLAALKKRGKANIGDKTMVDAFEPAVAALVEAADKGNSLIDGFESAQGRARAGMEYTRQCMARFGRAKSYGRASIGVEDAGAASIWIIFRAMAEWMRTHL
ncbi:MAG: dihydroxyacetone kinase subunit DhaL [Tepidanaerobacteraceae bacterium]|jgi:dihydroxyacetone kinase-like protein|nr:dihydroxyacetone kinase subunit DhaL [Tepidanaerobacteraceae bacterium]